ncbi:fungal-specific transcription factor domain-containing protein [Gongronella butleri]|nr:fungal-specific transcription factor domain-containing protein [Gongronella butleri]
MDSSSSSSKRDDPGTTNAKEHRQKRFKVGKACYACRVKKIKCDGVQPCMQCKARQRPCTFSLDGTMDEEDVAINEAAASGGNSEASTPAAPPPAAQQPSAPSQAPSHQGKRTTAQDALILGVSQSIPSAEQWKKQWHQQMDATEQRLERLSQQELRGGKWHVQAQRLLEPFYQFDTPTHENKTSVGTDDEAKKKKKRGTVTNQSMGMVAAAGLNLPAKAQQRHWIDVYYEQKYALFPILPKDYFMDQFDHHGPLVSHSPVLLLALFAHAALADDDANQAELYARQAKLLLVDAEAHISTVVALCLVALYESPYATTRGQAYVGMAIQFSHQLGLFRRCAHVDYAQLELRKRVAWACYVLDKLTCVARDTPPMLTLDNVPLEIPVLHWPNEDHEHMEWQVAHIKLMQLAERIMRHSETNNHNNDDDYQKDQELLQWLRMLPPHLQWHAPTNVNDPVHAPTSLVGHIHLVFLLIQLRVLTPYALQPDHLLHARCTTVATHLTMLVDALVDKDVALLSNALVGTAAIVASRAHLLLQANSNADRARQCFQRTTRVLLKITRQRHFAVPDLAKYIQCVDQELKRADASSSAAAAEAAAVAAAAAAASLLESPSIYINGSAEASSSAASSSSSSSSHALHHQQAHSGFHIPDTPATTASLHSSTHPFFHQHGTMTTHLHQQQAEELHDPLAFLHQPTTWFERMAPSSLDALLYKSRSIVEHAGDDLLNGGGLLMSHAKLNDPATLSTWFKQLHESTPSSSSISSNSHHHDHANHVHHPPIHALPTSTSTSSSASSDTGILWTAQDQHQHDHHHQQQQQQQQQQQHQQQHQHQQHQHHPQHQPLYTKEEQHIESPAAAQITPRPLGQYMNIGLGVYASAHQHHSDVIRQHIPEMNGNSNNHLARSVILTHQGQVIVKQDPTDFTPPAP